ncbi:helix-turn-helix transcriptional regulator [Streptomyces sp. NPDC059176]|uniref:helix-turn-helix transcriptional regulator n=1 Tax=Streptomyces sp. NPDC059176 TaxID=3346758 RepID=UPI0036D207CD
MRSDPDPDIDWILDRRRSIGQNVRRERVRANLTQERLRDASGVDRITIQRIEAGATDARISWLLRIARACGVPVGRLLGDQ